MLQDDKNCKKNRTCKELFIERKDPFTRAILHVAIVILVYVINSWQST